MDDARWEMRLAEFIGQEIAKPMRWWRRTQDGRIVDLVSLAFVYAITFVALGLGVIIAVPLLIVALGREATGW
jgi:hypothetical protein